MREGGRVGVWWGNVSNISDGGEVGRVTAFVLNMMGGGGGEIQYLRDVV